MHKTKSTLHIFAGGPLVAFAKEIATRLGWSMVFRTGDRFMNMIPKLGHNKKVSVGDDIASLMVEGVVPKTGDDGTSFSALGNFLKKSSICLMVKYSICMISHYQSFGARVEHNG